MSKLGPKWNREFLDVWDSTIGFYKIWVLHLGRRYGIFRELAKNTEPISPKVLSEKLGLYENAVSLWCDAAYATGIIRKERKGYALPRQLIPLLVEENNVRFIGALPSYLALRSLDFGLFDQFFKHGQIPNVQPHLAEAFSEGTIWDHTAFLKLLLPKEKKISSILSQGAKVLDVGCGTGNWSIRLAKKFPKSTFYGVDPDPTAVSKGEMKAKELGLPNVKFAVQSAESMNFAEEFDLAYLGEVLYLIREKEAALNACLKALRDGGFLVLCEALAPSRVTMRAVENQLVQAMQLDFALLGGGSLTKSLC